MNIEFVDGLKPLTDRPQRLHDIWDRWRGGRAMPSHHDVMQEDLRDLLPYIGLMEAATDPAECRYILAGTVVDAMAVESFKGRTIREAMTTGDLSSLAEIAAFYGTVIASRAPCFSRGNMAYQNRDHIIFDRALLPLSANGQAVDHILCGFFYNEI